MYAVGQVHRSSSVEKLELCVDREDPRYYRQHHEPRYVTELKSREGNSLYCYIGMEREMHKVWIVLDLEDLRECIQTPDWLTERLSHVKTFVLYFHGYNFPHDMLLEICGVPTVDDDNEFTNSFHWLMKIGLPDYSTLRFIEVRISHHVQQHSRDSILHLVEQFDRC